MTDRSSHHFQTTQWTAILQSSGSSTLARVALEDLCKQYYRPVEFFIERWLNQKNTHVARNARIDAKDLTQAYFTKLLSGSHFAHVDPLKGKFRSYLLASVKNFLLDHESQQFAHKRGGGQPLLSLSAVVQNSDAENIDSVTSALSDILSDPNAFPSEAYFDREWAIAIVEQAIDQVKQEYLGGSTSPRDSDRFQLLQSAITSPYTAQISTCRWDELQWNENAFRVALHRIRKRFRHFVQKSVSSTLSDPSEIDSEIGYLIKAFSTAKIGKGGEVTA